MKSGLICIFAGILFFFNPCFNMFDILPDFVGCILIVLGLERLSKIDANLESARKCAIYYGWISFARLILTVWTNTSHSDYLVPFTFSLCVLDIIFLLAFFRNLYTGIDYFSMRNESPSLREPASNAFSISVIFTVLSRILEFIPNIIELVRQNNELDLSYDAYRKMPLTAIKPYIMAICLLLCLILGVFFAVITAKFFFKAFSDKNFISKATEKYSADILSDKGLYTSLIMPGVYGFMYFALFFLYNFSVDAVNLLPSFISSVLILFAFARLKMLDGSLKLPVIPFTISFISGIANYIYTTKVSLGINYLYGTESLNVQKFEFLENPMCVAVQAVLSGIEAVSTLVFLFMLYNGTKRVFGQSLRSTGIKKLTVCKINAVILFVLSFMQSFVRAICASLATNSSVNRYIMTRAVISNKEELADVLSQPLIRIFDTLDTTTIIISALFFIAAAWNIMYLSKVNLSTEGSK